MRALPFREKHWLEWSCIAVIGLVLLIRFPGKFLLEKPFLIDFEVYQFAAHLIITGQSHLLYEATYSPGMHFKYAPIWAILWSPLAWLSNLHGAILWSVLNVGWVILTCWVSGRIARHVGFASFWWAPAAAVLLLSRPLIGEFSNGQADLWWAGLVVLFIFWELTGRHGLAACALALSVLLKLPSALFLVYAAFHRRSLCWSTGLWFASLLVVGTLFPTPEPFQLVFAWVHRLAVMGPTYVLQIGDQSLLALLGRLLSNDGYGLNVAALPRPVLVALALIANVALVAMVVTPRTGWIPSTRRFALDAAMLMILMVLSSPSAWTATYVAFLFPLIMALVVGARTIRSCRTSPCTLVLVILVGAFSLMTHSTFWKSIGVRSWRNESYVFLVFMALPLLGLGLLAFLWRQRSLVMGQINTAEHAEPSR
jgi:hypothetical protein